MAQGIHQVGPDDIDTVLTRFTTRIENTDLDTLLKPPAAD